MDMDNLSKGSIVCLGIGITLGSHLSPLAKSYIEQADVVFSLASDGIVEQWLEGMNSDTRSLQPYYHEGLSREITYTNMVNAILQEVSKGKKVVGAFYGHPGVFACVPHRVIEQARELGCHALMEPGISAEDCLYADLGIDPGEFGCAQFEASQFMLFERKIDLSAYLILWQVSIAGDISLTKFSTNLDYRKVLVDLLSQQYPCDHQVILYEAPTLPIHSPRVEKLMISELLGAELNPHTTLVLPPCEDLIRNSRISKQLTALALSN